MTTNFDDAGESEAAGRDPRLFNESLGKAMRVLGVFGHERPVTIAEAAKLAGISRSAAQRYVYTWRELKFIKRAEPAGGYVLAPKVLDIASRYLQTNSALERAQPYLAEAGRRTLETVLWGELDDTDYVMLFRIPSPRPLNVYTPVGKRFPAYATSSGLAMLAFMPPPRAKDILDRSDIVARTPHTVTDRRELDRIMAMARETGYVVTEQALELGGLSVAAPIFDSSDRPVAAVNITALLSRHSRQSVETEFAPVVIETAQVISSVLGNKSRRFPIPEVG